MKNPKLLFATNILIITYLGVIIFYMFNDFFMFEARHPGGIHPQTSNSTNSTTEHSSAFQESLQYQYKKDPQNIINLKIYLMVHNIILIFVFRLSISRQTQGWRNVNNILTIILLISSIYGVMMYIWPIYYSNQEGGKGDGKVAEEKPPLTLQDLRHEERKDSGPWLEIILVGSVMVPLVLVSVFILTIIIILCIYLKENIRGLGRLFGKDDSNVNRPDKEYENEMLRRKFAKDGPDHIELEEEMEDDDEMRDQQTFQSKRQVMQFYIDMMPRTEYKMKGSMSDNSNDESARIVDSNRASIITKDKKKNDGTICYPLCEKKFKEGDVLRTIMPCGHVFHERCIKIWLFRGENQFCPFCRGNIMKKSLEMPNKVASSTVLKKG